MINDINENEHYTFQTRDNQIIEFSSDIEKMINVQLPKNEVIMLQMSSFTLNNLLLYCGQHKFEKPNEIKRPLNDDIRMCIRSTWDLNFVKQFTVDELVILLNESAELECDIFQDLLMTTLALEIRNGHKNDLMALLKIGKDEFTEKQVNDILVSHSHLFKIDTDRVKEFIDND